PVVRADPRGPAGARRVRGLPRRAARAGPARAERGRTTLPARLTPPPSPPPSLPPPMPVVRDKRFLRVTLGMVGRCQLRCIMCHFAHPEFVESKTTMGRELLERVADDLFPRAHDVVLSSSAEPLMAPELPRALELCREHGVPSFHFSTNGMSLTEKIVDKVIEVQMPVITISIDAGEKEIFERIRTPAKWERVISRF